MTSQKQGETPPKMAQEREVIPTDSESYRSPVDSNIHKSGVAAQTNAKSSATSESESIDQMTEGANSQETKKRQGQ